jgi:glycogen synthase
MEKLLEKITEEVKAIQRLCAAPYWTPSRRHSIKDKADMALRMLEEAKKLLEEASQIYEPHRKK